MFIVVYLWSCRTYRLAAYRQFILWIQKEHMGRRVRQILPACVVSYIRRNYPEPSGNYTGFNDAVEQVNF